MNNKKNSALIVLIVLIGTILVSFASIQIKSTYRLTSHPASIFSVEMYNNGFTDVLIGNYPNNPSNSFTILKNKGNGIFQIIDSCNLFGGYQTSIFAAKINNDQLPDIVTFADDMKGFRIFFNDNGIFTSSKSFSFSPSGSPYSSISYGDVNGDGFIDIIGRVNNEGFWSILYNNGDETFCEPLKYIGTVGFPLFVCQCIDLDNDGQSEIITYSEKIHVQYYSESGFDKVELPITQQSIFFSADLDGDGINELFASELNYGVSPCQILKIMPNREFEIVKTLPTIRRHDVIVSDFDKNGLPDIAVLSSRPYLEPWEIDTSGIYIYYNLGNFQFSNPKYIKLDRTNVDRWRFSCGDYDNNGFLDFAVIKSVPAPAANLEFYFNDGNGNFLPEPISVKEIEKTLSTTLKCYPNPFVEKITIEYSINSTANIEICVYDVNGKFIQAICREKQQMGTHKVEWGGLNKIYSPTNFQRTFLIGLKVDGTIEHTMKVINY